MDLMWSEYEGQIIDGHPLNSFLGVRDGRAFYVSAAGVKGTPALLQLQRADSRDADLQLDTWSRAAMLSHANLIHVYAAGRGTVGDQPVVYSVAQLPDDDLSEILPKRTLDREEARIALLALSNALAYLHEQGLAHHAVVPANVFAVGNDIKLAVDTISPGGSDEQRSDVHQLGATLVEVLTGRKVSDASAVPRLEDPFLEVAAGCLSADSTWTASRVADRLSGRSEPAAAPTRAEEVSPAPRAVREPAYAAVSEPDMDSPEQSKPVWPWAAALAVAGGLGFFVWKKPATEAPQPVPVATERPAPTAPPVAPPAAAPAHASRSRVPQASVQPGWAVIVATYGSYDGAAHRANQVRQRWPKFEVNVAPAPGQGNRYFVLLGSGLSKRDAQALQHRARSAGFPRDTYVTSFRK